jgi:hypothetical protein
MDPILIAEYSGGVGAVMAALIAAIVLIRQDRLVRLQAAMKDTATSQSDDRKSFREATTNFQNLTLEAIKTLNQANGDLLMRAQKCEARDAECRMELAMVKTVLITHGLMDGAGKMITKDIPT